MPVERVANKTPGAFGSILLGKLIGANMNSTADQLIPLADNPTRYRIRYIVATNASISLTTAAGGIYPAVSKGGTAVVGSGQAYSSLTASTLTLDLTLAVATTVQTTDALYLSLTTAQGAAATADFYVYGDVLAD